MSELDAEAALDPARLRSHLIDEGRHLLEVTTFIQGRAYVVPEDVKAIAYDVLRHRLVLSYEAAAEQMTAERIIEQILGAVAVP